MDLVLPNRGRFGYSRPIVRWTRSVLWLGSFMARWSLKGFVPFIMLVGAACATSGDVERRQAAQQVENAGVTFFSEAYGHIGNHYVREIEMRGLVLDGLAALNQVDDQLDIREQPGQGRIAISHGGEVRSQLPLPQSDDPDIWADFTVDAITAARMVSPPLRNADAERIYETVMDNVVAHLDVFSRYSSAAEAREIRAVREGYTGLGISVREAENGIQIMRVYRDTPAQAAGLRRNDVIIAVEGEPIAGQELRAVVQRLRGPVGSEVTITIAREGRAPFDVSVRREQVTPNMVQYRREGDIAYISVERFTSHTGDQVAAAVRRAQADIGPGVRGYVLDLRNNPGGLLFESIRVSNVFMDGGRVVSTRGRHPDSQQNYFARVGDLTEGAPLVVLINGRSASASEIVAGALQDSGRAIVVGSNSFGKGTVQSEVDLPNTGALSITWSRFHAPSGYALHGLGVLPNVCTSRTGQTEGRIVTRLRAGRTVTAGYFERWRTTPIDNDDMRTTLRRVCPAVVADIDPNNDSELELAKRLIHEQGLYRAAISVARPGVAARASGQQSAVPASADWYNQRGAQN